MPTVLRVEGFRFFVFPEDHEPPHVHVFKAGEEAKLKLGDENTPPEVWDPMEMATHEVRKAARIVEANQAELLAAWRKYHA